MPEESNTRPRRSKGRLPSSGWGVFEARGFGPLWLAWVPAGLCMVRFDGMPPSSAEWARWIPDVEAAGPTEVPASIASVLTGYFDAQEVDPGSIPVRLGGTKFQRRVWEALRRVPRGRVRTYAGLAIDAGSPRATRAVGVAMAQNPIPIAVPCHRVVGNGLTLGGFSGGLDRKRHLLALEGVRVEGDRVRPGQLDLFEP